MIAYAFWPFKVIQGHRFFAQIESPYVTSCIVTIHNVTDRHTETNYDDRRHIMTIAYSRTLQYNCNVRIKYLHSDWFSWNLLSDDMTRECKLLLHAVRYSATDMDVKLISSRVNLFICIMDHAGTNHAWLVSPRLEVSIQYSWFNARSCSDSQHLHC